MTLGIMVHLSGPQFSVPQKEENNSTYLTGLFLRIKQSDVYKFLCIQEELNKNQL